MQSNQSAVRVRVRYPCQVTVMDMQHKHNDNAIYKKYYICP